MESKRNMPFWVAAENLREQRPSVKVVLFFRIEYSKQKFEYHPLKPIFDTSSRLSRPFLRKGTDLWKWLTRFRNEIYQSWILRTIHPNREPTGFPMRWSTMFFTNKTFHMSAAPTSRKVRTLRNYDGDGNRNVKKAIGLMSKITTLHVHHAFLYISLPSLHN